MEEINELDAARMVTVNSAIAILDNTFIDIFCAVN